MLTLAVGCSVLAPQATLEATGVVIDVDGPTAAQVDRFTINTPTGLVMDFIVGTLDVSDGGLPAPHLRDHLVSGEPIRVTYTIDEEGQNVALRYVDAR